MSYHIDSVKEKIIEKAVRLMYSKPGYELKLSEISEATKVAPPVLYNYFSGIDEIKKEVFKKIEDDLLAISNLKIPNSVSPDLKIITIGFNLVRYFEETGLSTSYILEEKNGMPVNVSGLKKNMITLFEKTDNLLFDPDLCTGIFLAYISAHISYCRKNNLKVPEDVCDKALKLVIK